MQQSENQLTILKRKCVPVTVVTLITYPRMQLKKFRNG
jgi:hypothetical protein